MKVEKLISFYNACKEIGFVKLLCDEKSNGAVSLYAPVKIGNGKTGIFTFDDEDMDFYKLIGKTCWISQDDATKNVLLINKFLSKMDKKFKDEELYISVSFKKKLFKTVGYIKCINATRKNAVYSMKFKAFTVNNNVQ